MKYAVVRTGGKQYKVAEGESLRVEHINQEPNSEYIFPEVLMVNDEGKVNLGTPLVTDVLVKGILVSHVKGDKIRVAKFKSKVRYRKIIGHRQSLSEIKITAIGTAKIEKADEKTAKTAKPRASKVENK